MIYLLTSRGYLNITLNTHTLSLLVSFLIKCGPNAETGRRVWDYDYQDWLGSEGYSGLVYDMTFPINPITESALGTMV